MAPVLGLWLAMAVAVDQILGLSRIVDVWDGGSSVGRYRATGLWLEHGPEILLLIVFVGAIWIRVGSTTHRRRLGWVCLGVGVVSLLAAPWLYYSALRVLETVPVTRIDRFETAVYRGMGMLALLGLLQVAVGLRLARGAGVQSEVAGAN
jgi:hypothetical protein